MIVRNHNIDVKAILQVSVYPYEVQPENPNSYRARKREYFRLQREKKKARKEGFSIEPQLVMASADAENTKDNPVCWLSSYS